MKQRCHNGSQRYQINGHRPGIHRRNQTSVHRPESQDERHRNPDGGQPQPDNTGAHEDYSTTRRCCQPSTPGVDLRSARHAAQRCRRAIERAPIAGVPITVTVGIAEYLPGKGVNDAICRADAMLYQAKAAGRNRVITEACELV
ncbi:diguanylate cyclase [Marinobacter sp. JB05H06]|nr:diguanylate cyclase [Marinobacter sp. JB05H06]